MESNNNTKNGNLSISGRDAVQSPKEKRADIKEVPEGRKVWIKDMGWF